MKGWSRSGPLIGSNNFERQAFPDPKKAFRGPIKKVEITVLIKPLLSDEPPKFLTLSPALLTTSKPMLPNKTVSCSKRMPPPEFVKFTGSPTTVTSVPPIR